MKKIFLTIILVLLIPAVCMSASIIQSAKTGLASAVTSWGILITGTTMTFTNSSTAVVGVGTTFTTDLIVNDYIMGSDGVWYQVQSITDNFNLVLTGAYGGTTGSPTYKIKQVTTVPAENDKVNIYHTITLDNTYVWGDDTTTAVNIKSGGILKASRSANSQLTTKGTFLVASGGELDAGKSGGDNIPTGITFTMKINYSASMAQNKYPMTISSGGKWYSWGQTKTKNTLLNGAINVGATSAILDDVTGWAANDTIVFACTDTYANRAKYDVKTISTIDVPNKTITFVATTYAHADDCEVGNFTSNVTYTNYSDTYTDRGTITCAVAATAGLVEIEYASFWKLAGSGNTVLSMTGTNNAVNIISFAHNTFYNAHGSAGTLLLQPGSSITYTDLAFFTNETAINANGSDFFWYGGSGTATYSNSVHYARPQGSHMSSGGSQGGCNIILSNITFISNGSQCCGGTGFGWTINNCKFYAVAYAVSASFTSGWRFNTCTLGTSARSISSVVSMSTGYAPDVIFTDCNFSYTSTFNTSASTQYLAIDGYRVIVANKNVDPLQQEIYTNGGNLIRDNSVFKAGTASLRFDRIASSTKAASNSWYVFAPTSKAVCVTGYLRKNSSYGSSTLPYVTLSGLGITTDTSTMTDVNDTWWQFKVSGTQTTGTDGMLTLTFYAQSSVASASAWIDEISAVSSAAVNSGGLEYWANGQPAQVIAANYVAPIDVWNVLTADTTLAASHGLQANNTRTQVENTKAMIAAN